MLEDQEKKNQGSLNFSRIANEIIKGKITY